jgi:hypothetical protein
MKKTLMLLMLIASITHGETIPMAQITNVYLTITMPSSWSLEIAGGKERQMQMSIRIPSDTGGKRPISMFAQWDGLDPRKWVGTNVVAKYSLGNRDFFIRSTNGTNDMEIVTQGEKYAISATVPLALEPETLGLLLNSLATMKAR